MYDGYHKSVSTTTAMYCSIHVMVSVCFSEISYIYAQRGTRGSRGGASPISRSTSSLLAYALCVIDGDVGVLDS